MTSRQPESSDGADGASTSLAELVSRLAAEGRELLEVELARGKAIAAAKKTYVARVVVFALLAFALAVVAITAVSAATVLVLTVLGLAAWGAAGLVAVALVIGAALAARGLRSAAGELTAAERDRAWRFESLYRGAVLVGPWVPRGRVPGPEPRAKLRRALAVLGRDAGIVIDAAVFDRLDPGDLARLRAALRRL